MTELELTTEAEVEDFTDELSDEALDREGGRFSSCTTRDAVCAAALHS